MTDTTINCDTFVKSILGAMWMLNDLPKNMRQNLDNQLGIIWLLISDQNCFPTIEFTASQQKAICEALAACSDHKASLDDQEQEQQEKEKDEEKEEEEEFKYTYEAMLMNPNLKQSKSK